MQLVIHRFRIKIKQPIRVSRETYAYKDCIIVELELDGLKGYGEATAFEVYGSSIETMSALLESLKPRLARYAFTTPAQMWQDFHPQLAGNPFVQCALDVAAYDLYGKQLAQPIHRLLGLDIMRVPYSNYTLGMDTIPNTVAKLQALAGWPIFKIKLGGIDDIELIRTLRQHSDAVFRVDANCGWDVEETISKSALLKELGVDFIEQPLRADDFAGMQRLHGRCQLPLVADESCTTPASIEHCKDVFQGVNLKLMKCGGITPALDMIGTARRYGLQVMMGCMPESSIGVSAIAQLAPLLDCVDIDSIVLIENDLADGVKLEYGNIIYPDRPGNGCAPNF